MSLRGALMGAVAGASFLLVALSSDSEARTRCSYSGAPENALTVTADRGALGEIARRGRRIVVREYLERSRPCRGGVPTVLNTDTIRVLSRPGSFVDVFLRHGPFAPGATGERRGASEIEIKMEFRGRSDSGFGEVYGTMGADEFHWGPGPAKYAGLNLNPRDAGDRDVDVTVRGPETFLVANGGAGNDTIVPAPGAQFPNHGVDSTGGPGDDLLIAPRNKWGVLEGGGGNDILLGGREGDELAAGDGDDRVTSDGGDDSIRAGPGHDLISSGPGRDRIRSLDSERDWGDCGTNRDRAFADRQDRLRGCEVVRHHPPPPSGDEPAGKTAHVAVRESCPTLACPVVRRSPSDTG
jgi:hypothetical protein